MIILAIAVFAAGTLALKASGSLLRDRLTMNERTENLLKVAATVVIAALVVLSVVFKDGDFAGWALPIGVIAGGIAAWFRAPFALVILIAATVTAVLRQLGA
ncbi:AzlD domain-containing protein [Haloglycomyces albus]|uniref:AzlD domain-containing protein n=1 Tax=Haloglycomyces albus TaxID=526067 RepID=UPI00046D1251|nr:AzlD domain-containing protein [Haloglycomyces albus]